jgi:two-component system chemotaxis sensor kinase CheA
VDSAQYAELFLTESREHVSAINHSLLALERGAGGDEPVGAIFRGVHTIKGMSATMGYTAVASLSHELETLLDLVRKGGRTVDARLMDLLFRAADLLERAIESAVSGVAAVDVSPMVAQLQAEALRGGTPTYSSLAVTSEFPIGVTTEFPIPVTSEFAVPVPDAWTARAPQGPGLLVRVRLIAGTPLKGVRAFLVVEAAKKLGTVGAVSPAIEQLQADEFENDFALRLTTDLTEDDVVAALRRAGDVDEVRAGEDVAAPAAAPTATNGNGASGAMPANGNGANGSSGVRQQRSVRIDLRRLDNLMNLIGELVITRGRLMQLTSPIDDPALAETVAQTSRLVADLQDEIMTSRMVPVWQVFDRFPRLVRDAARSLGKQVNLVVAG